MSDETTIQPALSESQWAEWLNEDDANGLGYGVYRLRHQPDVVEHQVRRYANGITVQEEYDVGEVISPDDRDRHALAALALHSQRFGFSHAEVTILRSAAQFYESHSLARIADKIAALLPPEG